MATSKLKATVDIKLTKWRRLRLYVYMLWLVGKGYSEDEITDKCCKYVEKWLTVKVTHGA